MRVFLLSACLFVCLLVVCLSVCIFERRFLGACVFFIRSACLLVFLSFSLVHFAPLIFTGLFLRYPPSFQLKCGCSKRNWLCDLYAHVCN